MDLLGHGSLSPADIEDVFRDICQQQVEEDGLEFQADTVRAEAMRADEEYQGVRVKLNAQLARARVSVQVDIGFGDAVTPGPEEVTYPTLLDYPAPLLKAYPRETVVAEKFQAMVMLGIANSRMKDFYDLWFLAKQFEFDGHMICQAIQATFDRRKTRLPAQPPLALTPEFAGDRNKSTQWQAFLKRGMLTGEPLSLADVVNVLNPFLMPPTEAIVANKAFMRRWPPRGPWTLLGEE